jgi:hypothetical protein
VDVDEQSCTATRGPIERALARKLDAADDVLPLAGKHPEESRRDRSGKRFARTPSARKRSVSQPCRSCARRNSVWPMIAIERPPFTAQASASERMVLLVALVITLPRCATR